MEDTIHTTFSRNPLATFALQPQGVTFETQEQGEKIILLLRAHLVTLIPPVFITLFFLAVPFFLLPILGALNIDLQSFLSPRQVFLLTIFWYLATFGYAFFQFLFWYFNVYILTNERVVDIDFRGLLHKQTAYALLGQIEDVVPKTIGFFGTFFNYGNVYIQTAGEKTEFEFTNVPRPEMVAQEILEQKRIEEGEPPGVVA